MADLPAPLKVSPLIRAGRWGFLVLGVAWGAARHRSLSKKEAKIREVEDKNKAVRDAKLAEEKKRLAKLEMDTLARAAGVPPEP